MIRLFITLIAALGTALLMGATPAPGDPSQALVGTWDVSLYYAPDKPPSSTVMVIDRITGDRLEGTFYGTPFSVARSNRFRDAVLFSAVTADNSGDYLHSGRLVDGMIAGQTHSVGREFLTPWTAVKRAE